MKQLSKKNVELCFQHLATGMKEPTQLELAKELKVAQPAVYRVIYRAMKQVNDHTKFKSVRGELTRFKNRLSNET